MRKALLIILLLLLAAGAYGQEKALTKGEVIEQLSAADFMKAKIGQLLSWTVGYDISKVNRASLVPTINYIKAEPKKVPPDNRTVLEITAGVDDPGGLRNIGGVRSDLSQIGKFPNMTMVDNGLWGDVKADDGIFTIQTNVNTGIVDGEKEITVAAVNKKGWLAVSRTKVDVFRNPEIVEYSLTPEKLSAGSSTVVKLEVKVENPGRLEDLEEVTADLSDLGKSRQVEMSMISGGVFTLEFEAPALPEGGSKRVIVVARNRAGGSSSLTIDLEAQR